MPTITDSVQTWLDQHWSGSHACPVCQQRRWHPLDDLTSVGIHAVILVVCQECQYTLLFYAAGMGLAPVEGI